MDMKFDKMTFETSLVEEYIKSNKGLSELYEDYSGTIKKKSEVLDKISQEIKSTVLLESVQLSEISKVQLLVSLLKQNATLIMQLEYHIRNIPMEDTKAQMDIIIKNLKCYSAKNVEKYPRGGEVSIFTSNDDLLGLARLFTVIMYSKDSSASLKNYYKETAVISHLFVKLCNDAGFYGTSLIYSDGCKTFKGAAPKYYSGTVAVVSEDADVDSAVDTFLSASTQTPWRLQRILVQESIYQQFKDALSWKCNLAKGEGGPQASDVLCSETLTYNGKVFLIDPVQDVPVENQTNVVAIEAYRTRKEMISLLQKYNAHFLSLWANGIAEINEVTFSETSPVVWVNSFGDFRGPSQISKAVLDYDINTYTYIKKCDKISKLCDYSKSWMKLDFESRLDVLCGALDKCLISDSTNKVYANIKKSLLDCSTNSFVDFGKDYVCVGIGTPLGIMGINNNEDIFTFESFRSLLYGNAFVLVNKEVHDTQVTKLELIDLIGQAGVPIVYVDYVAGGEFQVLDWVTSIDYKTKVIWTNSGTIFAN